MENQDFKNELMDYLYDEMTAKERKEFELKLESDTELLAEYKALKDVRTKLDKLEDKEVMEPFSTWRMSKSKDFFGVSTKRKTIIFRPVTAVAASLLILMIVGYLTSFSISINDKGVFLGYGKSTEVEKVFGEEQASALVQDAIRKNNESLMATMVSSENSIQNQFSSLEEKLSSQIDTKYASSVTDQDLQNFFTSVESRNSELMKEYLKLTSNHQQEYFKTMLTQFDDFMQEQRKQDLTVIRNNLIELKQSQSLQKQETDQVIASILTAVNQKSQN